MDAILHRKRPSAWQLFLESPLLFVARRLYEIRRIKPFQPVLNPVTVVCISDTHDNLPLLPEGDILIHAGDLTQTGSQDAIQASLDWLEGQPHPHKIVVAGNHDQSLYHSDDPKRDFDWGDVHYLQEGSTTITVANGRSLLIYGSPWTPGKLAFQYPRGHDKWRDTISSDVDILITHGPPRAHLDLMHIGCDSLLEEIWRVRPRLHVFGHVHAGYGTEWVAFDEVQRVFEQYFRPLKEARGCLVNAAIVGGFLDTERRAPTVVVL